MASGTATGRIQHLLDDIAAAGEGDRVSVRQVMDGRSSFGAILLVPSLVIVSPLSGIPGVPTASAVVIILICLQYIAGSRSIWLPDRINRIALSRKRLAGALDRVRPVARLGDRIARPRHTYLLNRTTVIAIAVVCGLLAATMPPMEVLPLTSSIAAFIIATFALAVLARDGTLALVAAGLTASAVLLASLYILPHL